MRAPSLIAAIAATALTVAAQKQATADVAVNQANVQTAGITLGYASVTAPISGRIGRSLVTEGALAGQGEAAMAASAAAPDPAAAAAAPAQAASPPATGLDHAQALRVCADPDNLPYSHEDGSGFENRIAQLVADDLGLLLRYEWLPDRRGFVRKTLGARLCDVIIGVPVGFERAATTEAYYRSSYVWVQRCDSGPALRAFDDPRLRQLRIGVQLIGNDLAASPPGHALARRGAARNVIGFPVPGEEPAAARMVRAVAQGQLDAAVVWGPQAGYFASRATVPMRLSRLAPPPWLHGQTFDFSIAMGVRRGDVALRQRLDEVIARRQGDIDRILQAYAVPRLPGAGP